MVENFNGTRDDWCDCSILWEDYLKQSKWWINYGIRYMNWFLELKRCFLMFSTWIIKILMLLGQFVLNRLYQISTSTFIPTTKSCSFNFQSSDLIKLRKTDFLLSILFSPPIISTFLHYLINGDSLWKINWCKIDSLVL